MTVNEAEWKKTIYEIKALLLYLGCLYVSLLKDTMHVNVNNHQLLCIQTREQIKQQLASEIF